MGKDNKGRELGRGLYQRKDGRYEARAKVNGKNIDIFERNLRELKKRFFEINVPRENRQVKRRFLSPEEQSTFLKTVEHNWYKEMFYIMFLTGMKIGEIL